MTTQPMKSNSKMLYLQAKNLFDQAKTAFEDGTIKTQTQLIQNVFRSFEDFFTSVGKPSMIPRYAPEDGPPWSEDYNDMMDEIKEDLEILFEEIDSIGQALYTDFNHNMVQQDLLTQKFEEVVDKMKDLELYSGVVEGSVEFARDDFLNKDKIDYDRISGTPLEVTNGSVSLPMSIRENISPESKVTIVIGNSEKGNYALGTESNGFPGNNTEIHTTTDGVLTSQNYAPTFIGDESNHGNYAVVLDGSPNTWFEYEKANVRDHDKTKVAKNIGWDYRVYENTTIQWAEDPYNGVLKLHMQIILPEEKMINQINCNMYTPPNYGAKTAIVKDILVSDGKTPPQSVLPVNKQDTDYNFNFEPKNAKVVSVLFEQPYKYMTDIGHIYYDQKSETQDADEYAMDAVSQQNRNTVRTEGPIISLQDLGLDVSVSDTNIDVKYPLLDGTFSDDKSMSVIISELTHGIQTENVDIGIEKFEGWRWAIGIRDIEIYSCEYETEGELISKPFYFNNPIEKISLDVDELIPEPLTQDTDTKYDYLQYFISIDDGGQWYPITPMAHQIISEDQPPKIYTVQTIQNDDQQLEGKSGYIESETPVYSVRLKVVATRPEDNTVEETDDSDDTETQSMNQISPILNSYSLEVMTTGEPSDSQESFRMIAGDAGLTPYDPTADTPDLNDGTTDNQQDTDDEVKLPDAGCDPTNPWYASDPNSPCYQPDCDPTDPNSWCYCDPDDPASWCNQPKPEEPVEVEDPECDPRDPFSDCYQPPKQNDQPSNNNSYDGQLKVWIDNKPKENMERHVCIDQDIQIQGHIQGPKILRSATVYFNGQEIDIFNIQIDLGNVYEAKYEFNIHDYIVNQYFNVGDRFGVKVVAEDIEGNKAEDNYMVQIVDCPGEETGDFPEESATDKEGIKVTIQDKPTKRRNICDDNDIQVKGTAVSMFNITKILFYLDETLIQEKTIEGNLTNVDFDFSIDASSIKALYEVGDSFLVKVRGEDAEGFHDVKSFEVRIANCPYEPPGDYNEERGPVRVTITTQTQGYDHIHECFEKAPDIKAYSVKGYVDADKPVHKLRYLLGNTLIKEVDLETSQQKKHVDFEFTIDLSNLVSLGPSEDITSVKVEALDEDGVKGSDLKNVCLVKCEKDLTIHFHKKGSFCFGKDLNIEAHAEGPNALSKAELYMVISGTLEKVSEKELYTDNENITFTVGQDFLTSKGFTLENASDIGDIKTGIEVRVYDVNGKEIRSSYNVAFTSCAGDEPVNELTITVDELNTEICNCDNLIIRGTVEGPNPIDEVILKINGTEIDPVDLGIPPADSPCADTVTINFQANKADEYCYDDEGIMITGTIGSNYPIQAVTLRVNGEIKAEKSFNEAVTNYPFNWVVEGEVGDKLFIQIEATSAQNAVSRELSWESVIRECPAQENGVVAASAFSMQEEDQPTYYEIDWVIPYWKLTQIGLVKGRPYVVEIKAYDTKSDKNYDTTIYLKDCEDSDNQSDDCWKTESIIVKYYSPINRKIEEEIIPIDNLPYHLDNGNGVIANVCLTSDGNTGPIIQVIGGNDQSEYAFQIWAVGVNYFTDSKKTEIKTEWATRIYAKSEGALNTELMLGDPGFKQPDEWIAAIENGDYSKAPGLHGMHDYVSFYISAGYSDNQCWESGICNPLAPPAEPAPPAQQVTCLEMTDLLVQYYSLDSQKLEMARIAITQDPDATYKVQQGLEIRVAWDVDLQAAAIEIIEGEGIENLLLTAVGMMYKDENGFAQTTWASQVRWKSQGVQIPEFALGGYKTIDQVIWVQNEAVNYTYATYVGAKGDIVAYQFDEEVIEKICVDQIPLQPVIAIPDDEIKPTIEFAELNLCIYGDLYNLTTYISDSMMLKEYKYQIMVNDELYGDEEGEEVPPDTLEFTIYPMVDLNALEVGDKVTLTVKVWNQYGAMTESTWEGLVGNCDSESPVITFDEVEDQICLADINDDGTYCVSFKVTDDQDIDRWHAYIKDETGEIAWEDELSYPELTTDTDMVSICPPVLLPNKEEIQSTLPPRTDIVFIIDSSASMNNASDTGYIGNLRKNIGKFVDYLKTNGFDAWIGYVDSNFADGQHQRMPLSAPQDVVSRFVVNTRPTPIQTDPDGEPGQGWEGMEWRQIIDGDKGGYSFFAAGAGNFRSGTKKHFVLVTDTCMGSSDENSTLGSPNAPDWLLEDLIEKNVTVSAIRLPGEDADPIYDPNSAPDTGEISYLSVRMASEDDETEEVYRGDYDEIVSVTGGVLLDISQPDLWTELEKLADMIMQSQTFYPDFCQEVYVEAWDNAGNQSQDTKKLCFHDCTLTPPPEIVSVQINEAPETLCWNSPTAPNAVKELTAKAVYKNVDGTTFEEDITSIGLWTNNNPAIVKILDDIGRKFEVNGEGQVTFTCSLGGMQGTVTFTINNCSDVTPPTIEILPYETDPQTGKICYSKIVNGKYCLDVKFDDNVDLDHYNVIVNGQPIQGTIDGKEQQVQVCLPITIPDKVEVPLNVQPQADIAFIFDTSGSMDPYISNIRNNLNQFIQSLVGEGIDVRLGYIDSNEYTADMQQALIPASQFSLDRVATNSGDWEGMAWRQITSSTQGGYWFLNQFRASATKYFVIVTDTNIAAELPANLISNLNSAGVHAVFVAKYKSGVLFEPDYQTIADGTGGKIYNMEDTNFSANMQSLANEIIHATKSYIPDSSLNITIEAFDNKNNKATKSHTLNFHDCSNS